MYQQSPINIITKNAKFNKSLKTLTLNYNNRSAYRLINTGNTVKVLCNLTYPMTIVSGPLKYNYTVEEIHLHWGKDNLIGSEHAINGKRYSGEIHIVHWNSSKYSNFNEAYNSPDGIAIIAIFLELGNYNVALQQITSNAHMITYKNSSLDIYNFNPKVLFPNILDYWYYNGSSTNIHINNVHWLVFKNPITISYSQLDDLRKLQSTTTDTVPKQYIYDNFKNPNNAISKLQLLSSFKTSSYDEECFLDKINIFTKLTPSTFIILIIVFILLSSIVVIGFFFIHKSPRKDKM
ncbi:carbonic anhydrase [Hypsugopox virus]|nr:carbonic anhydrase [Hypsugopox virus]